MKFGTLEQFFRSFADQLEREPDNSIEQMQISLERKMLHDAFVRMATQSNRPRKYSMPLTPKAQALIDRLAMPPLREGRSRIVSF